MTPIALLSHLAAATAYAAALCNMQKEPLIRRATQALRVIVLSLVTAGVSACGGGGSDSAPVAMSSQAASAPQSDNAQSSSPVSIAWPPADGPSRVFDYNSAVTPPVSDDTRASRLVLYDDGTFELQFADLQSGSVSGFSGRYQEAHGVINFDWDGTSAAGPWGATGRLDGASLTIQYNTVMGLTGFEDAVYVQTP